MSQFKEGLITNLPSTHPTLGTTISWTSDVPGTISPEGIVIRPVDLVDCVFTYEVISGDYSTQNVLRLEDFGGASEEEFLVKEYVCSFCNNKIIHPVSANNVITQNTIFVIRLILCFLLFLRKRLKTILTESVSPPQ